MILLTLEKVPYAVFNNQLECDKWLKDNDSRITFNCFDTYEVRYIDSMDATIDHWIERLNAIADYGWKAVYTPESKEYILDNAKVLIKDSIDHRRLLKFWLENIYKIPSSIYLIFHTEGEDND